MTPATHHDTAAAELRLRSDVATLCREPRHRSRPGALEAARRHCAQQLEEAGWQTWSEPFTVPTRARISDHGHPRSPLALQVEPNLSGLNLLASSPRHRPQAGDTLIVAHLDTVATSPGADDNGSGVAIALELARRISRDISGEHTTLALVDLEEVDLLGSRALARSLPAPGLVICLESLGYFSEQERSQGAPVGLGVLAPTLTRQLRAGGRRGDFVFGVHRADSAVFAQAWSNAAGDVGLRTVLFRDPRGGRGQRLTRWINPFLLDLDRSDHAPFWWRRIPSVMLTDTAVLRNRSYHRSSDTPDTLDYPRMERLTTALAHTLKSRKLLQ